ncbi:hypothetical protein GGR58DRAFT_494907 [Xylaria digitata]|nr:hypothetical protein GGR58DRAFT_494907 [Xylaria digitata]
MLPNPPPSSLSPAPSINVPGLTCTGTIYDTTCGSHVNYECHSKWSKNDFERFFELRSWIIFSLIFYFFQITSTGDPYQRILGLLNKLLPGSARALQPSSKVTQICALLVYLGILWLVRISTPIVLNEDWRMIRAAFVKWRPSLMPLRSGLLVSYPVWAVIFIFCVAFVASTIAGGILITATQILCIKKTALLITGRRQLDEGQQSPDFLRGNDSTGGEEDRLEKKQDVTESMKTPVPLSEKN